MEMKLPDGCSLVTEEEMIRVKKLSNLILSFERTYYVYNRQLNKLIKDAKRIIGEQQGGS